MQGGGPWLLGGAGMLRVLCVLASRGCGIAARAFRHTRFLLCAWLSLIHRRSSGLAVPASLPEALAGWRSGPCRCHRCAQAEAEWREFASAVAAAQALPRGRKPGERLWAAGPHGAWLELLRGYATGDASDADKAKAIKILHVSAGGRSRAGAVVFLKEGRCAVWELHSDGKYLVFSGRSSKSMPGLAAACLHGQERRGAAQASATSSTAGSSSLKPRNVR